MSVLTIAARPIKRLADGGVGVGVGDPAAGGHLPVARIDPHHNPA